MSPRGGRGQRAKRAGVGGGWSAKKVREWADAQLANLRIYPPQSLALFRVDKLYDPDKTIYVKTLIIALAKNLVGVIR